jgi:hypothetical protein
MDVFSHALWGYVVVRWRGPRTARWGLVTGAAPDLLYATAAFLRRVATRGWSGLNETFGRDPAIWRRDGPPMPEDLLYAYEHYYVFTHSFVILGMLGIAWLILRRKAPWLLLPWGLHILMDIPTHERYLTPFLFPLSMWTVEGYAWNRPPIFFANLAGLLVAYGILFWRYWLPGRAGRTQPWPEDLAPV